MISDFRNKSKILAVGGVDESNIDVVKNLNFDGIGLLGALWKEPNNALAKFTQIKNKMEK
jgi:thiamine-phosphate pyrophosphorylase